VAHKRHPELDNLKLNSAVAMVAMVASAWWLLRSELQIVTAGSFAFAF